MAASASFNGAYAIRLGAENFQVGLLSSIPALLAILISIPAGQFLQSKKRRKPWIIFSLSLNRLSYLLIALVPFFQVAEINSGTMVIIILIMASIPAHFFNVGFTPLLAEVIPEQNRVTVLSARNIIYNATYSLATFLFGLWLKNISLPINYQTMYLVGFIASCLSTYVLAKVEVPDADCPSDNESAHGNYFKELTVTVNEAFSSHPEFLRINRNTLFHGFGLWMVGPLYILYYVKILNAGDDWIGLQGTILSAATIAGYAFWRRVIKKWGEPDTLKRTIICAGLYPILAGAVPSLPFILIAVALNGLIAPGINLSHFNTLLKVMPEKDRPSYTALYNTIMNIGAFICPLLGVSLANMIGYPRAIILCGVLSIAGSFSFWISPVIRPEHANI